jgi:putative transposase
MKRSRFSEEQIIGILTAHEAGATCADLCRKHDMSEGTFYNWKAKFGDMTVSDAMRLKALEDENAQLKKLLAEQMLDGEFISTIGPRTMDELDEGTAFKRNSVKARREARDRCASVDPDGPVGTAGLPDCWGGSEDDPPPVDQTASDRAASAVARSGQ